MSTETFNYEDDYQEEETYGFEDEEEAVLRLYEELFDSPCELDNKVIYKAMRFLLWKKGLHPLYNEILELNEDMLRVEHVCKKES